MAASFMANFSYLSPQCQRPFSSPAAPSQRSRTTSRCIRGLVTRSQPSDSQDTAADLLRETEALLADLGRQPAPPDTGYLSDVEDTGYRFEVSCDVNGCIITPVSNDRGVAAGPPGLKSPVQNAAPENFEYHEGDGWKMGFDAAPNSNRQEYSAVIGSDQWSMALTWQEFVDFVQLLKNLRRSVATLDICGEWGEAGNEATLEMQTKRVWMQGRAPQQRLSTLQDFWRHGNESSASMDGSDISAAFSLRFIIRCPDRREVEGQFAAQTVMQIFEFLDDQRGFLSGIQGDPGMTPVAQEPRV